MQEELKSARTAAKSAEELLDLEKERSKAREQEAFTARYSLVGMQEQLDQALERIKTLEQERDAFKTLAKNEEDVTRIAAEGRLPLPAPDQDDGVEDEFASPKKSRVSSISITDVRSSASSEAEIEELTRMWQWEKQRADRAVEHVEFLEAECHLRCCVSAKSQQRSSTISTSASATPGSSCRKRPDPMQITDSGDLVILSEDGQESRVDTGKAPPLKKSKTERLRGEAKEARRSTIFVPSEGIFRTVSQAEAEALALTVQEEPPANSAKSTNPTAQAGPSKSPSPVPAGNASPPCYARSPSADPPTFASGAGHRTSLLSLLDAPHKQDDHHTVLNIPTTQARHPTPTRAIEPVHEPESRRENDRQHVETPPQRAPLAVADKNQQSQALAAARGSRPGSYQSFEDDEDDSYASATTTIAHPMEATTVTTKVPLRDENADPSLASRLLALQRTPSHGKNKDVNASFDATNPALTPTMSREQALAQIRERRGRARSAAQGAVTPRKQMVQGVERRDVSAPTGRVGGVVSATRQVRS